MAGRAEGSAIKALFSPSKGDPPPQVKKKKNTSPAPKNAPSPDQKEKTPPKKLPSPEKEEKSSPQKGGDKKENSWTAPRKYRSMSTTCSSEQRPSPVKYRSMALCSIWRR